MHPIHQKAFSLLSSSVPYTDLRELSGSAPLQHPIPQKAFSPETIKYCVTVLLSPSALPLPTPLFLTLLALLDQNFSRIPSFEIYSFLLPKWHQSVEVSEKSYDETFSHARINRHVTYRTKILTRQLLSFPVLNLRFPQNRHSILETRLANSQQ